MAASNGNSAIWCQVGSGSAGLAVRGNAWPQRPAVLRPEVDDLVVPVRRAGARVGVPTDLVGAADWQQGQRGVVGMASEQLLQRAKLCFQLNHATPRDLTMRIA